jgi:hypothetical protein
MRRALVCLIAGLLPVIGGLPVSNSWAQAPPSVTMWLASQSPWNDGRRPLELSFRVTNQSSVSLDALTVVLAIHSPARSRSVYELSLTSDATSILFAYPFAQSGSLEPGQTRLFQVRQPLDILQARGESVIYPLKVELRSGDTAVGVLRPPLIFLAERPEVPLNLSWTWVLSSAMQYGPDGAFLPGPLEADIAPGGRLDATITAIERARSKALDLVISAVFIDQLTRMSGGYRILDPRGQARSVEEGEAGAADAARLLERLRAVARRPEVEVIAYPLGDPPFPAMVGAGLGHRLRTLLEDGRTLVETVVGKDPSLEVLRPPLSQLDPPALARLGQLGATTLLVDPNFLPTPEGLMFSAPPVVELREGATSFATIVPDPMVPALATASAADPVVGAHAALGALAATWLELPGTPGRGAAVLFPEDPAVPGSFLRRFAALVRRSPWLEPVTASTLVELVPGRETRDLVTRDYPRIGQGYVSQLLRARASLGEFERTALEAGSLVGRFEQHLSLAEGIGATSPSLGQSFIDAVNQEIDGIYGQVTIDIDERVRTLTSRRGNIPITLRNRSGFRMRVQLEFVADRRLEFPGGRSLSLTLPTSSQTRLFPVLAQTTGRIPFKIRLRTSGSTAGTDTIAEADMIMRSTAYNRVALILTIGAAVFLLGWWGRRFLPRRTG